MSRAELLIKVNVVGLKSSDSLGRYSVGVHLPRTISSALDMS